MNILSVIFRKIFKLLYWGFAQFSYGSFGKGSSIHKPMFIPNKDHIFIGEHVHIRDFARIEPIVQWNGKKLNPRIIIEDSVFIEQGLHLTCAGNVHIHKGCLFAPYVYITDVMHDYQDINTSVLLQNITIKETEIGENCFLGIGAKILEGVKIGKHCIVGASSVVVRDIPDFCVVSGIPAKIIKRYNDQTNTWDKC